MRGACVRAARGACTVLLLASVAILKDAEAAACVSNASLSATGVLLTGSLEAGCALLMEVSPGPACDSSAYLLVELWDLGQLMLGDPIPAESSHRADPLLGMSQGMVPDAVYKGPSSWDIQPPEALFDEVGYELTAHYMTVQGIYNTSYSNRTWHVSVQNLDMYTTGDLQFQIRASCAMLPQCPSPMVSLSGNNVGQPQLCSGAGTCQQSSGICQCNLGFGNVGCDTQVLPIIEGQEQVHSLGSNEWMYWDLVVPDNASTVLVQLNRTAGDPVLFLKPLGAGFQVGGVPVVQDYADFADVDSFQQRLDYHYIVSTGVLAGRYYIGVYNNDAYFKETAQFSLLAVVQPASGDPVCPFNCSGHGTCVLPGVCACDASWQGVACQGGFKDIVVYNPRTVHGHLQPGHWDYYAMLLDPMDTSWMGGLLIDFDNSGGHAVLVMKADMLPTLLNADFTFRSEALVKGDQLFMVKPDSLQATTYYIGVFNMDYYIHQPYSYTLRVTPPGMPRLSLSPYLSIVLGVTLSVVFCLAAGLCRRYAALQNPDLAVHIASPEGPERAGLEAALIAGFPSYPYKVPAAPDVESGYINGGDTCSVCLGEYEMDEMLRRLPACKHEFHMSCIDEWLTSHTTCPMCRSSLLPPPAEAADAAEPITPEELDEASAPALELSPANSGVPLLLATDAISAPAADSSQSQASFCGRGLESNGRATHIPQQSQHVHGEADCSNAEAVTEMRSGRSSGSAPRRNTAEVAALSRDPDHWARKTIGNFPWRSPFEGFAQTVRHDCSARCVNSTTADGNGGQGGERCAYHVVGRKHSEPAKPVSGFSTWPALQMSSCRHAEQVLASPEAPGSSSPDEGDEGSSLCSSADHQTASLLPARDAAGVSIRAETEMVSLTSKEHCETSEEHGSCEEHAGAELASQRSRSLPCRTTSEASLARPRFNLVVYAGWLPPSLKSSLGSELTTG